MKIGMMADIYKTQVSGVTNSITLSKRWLEKMGHEVYIFTFGDDEVVDTEKNIIRTTGVPVVDTGIYFNLRYNRQARQMLYSDGHRPRSPSLRQWITSYALLCSKEYPCRLYQSYPLRSVSPSIYTHSSRTDR